MRKRIAGAIAVACLTGVVITGCSSNRYSEDKSPAPASTYNTGTFVTKVQVDGHSVTCIVLRESIDCDFAGDLEKRDTAQ